MSQYPERPEQPEQSEQSVQNEEAGDPAAEEPRTPPKSRRRWVWLAALAVLVVVAADPLGLHPGDDYLMHLLGFHGAEEEGAGDGTLWTCGMHPEVILDEPGQCPICHMDLVPLAAGDATDEAAAEPDHAAVEAQWSCPLHPSYRQDEPGECPICGLELEPVAEEGRAGAGGGASQGEREILFYRNPMDPSVTSPVPTTDEMGMDYVPVYADQAAGAVRQGATVTIDPTVVQNMNVRTAPVERRDVKRQIRTVGYLDYDQGKMVTVTTKVPGFIERVYVNYVGEPVRRGQRLFEIYSPELVQTQQELLSAAAYARRLDDAPEDVRRRAEGLLAAARQRLSYWDVSAAQVERIEAGGDVQRTLTVTAPASGLVMKRLPGLEGMAVQPGMELLHIADLSSLWLSVEVYEDQLPWLTSGARAVITLPYFPGETFLGTVRFVEPQVSERTRTVGLRLEVPNPEGRLRAGMYATVVFEPVTAADALVVPSLAVLRTGERNLVVVALGEGRFAPREVALGPEGDHYVQVLAGVEEGERVVTSAQFLLDSESNIREAIQKLVAARRAARGGDDAQ